MTRTRNTVIVLVVASLALILWDLRASDAAVRSAVQQVVTPLQRTATAVFAPFGRWAREVQEFGDPGVRAEVVRPAMAVAPPGWRTVTGRVVAADISGDRATVTMDAGSGEGVLAGNAVLGPGGLVGTVASVSPDSAVVLLVADPQSTVGVRVVPSGEMGVVTGQGLGRDLSLSALNPAASMAVGDEVVSLGSTGRAGVPPGIPVGRVSALDTRPVDSGRAADVNTVAGTTTLDALLVLTGRR